MSDEGINAAAGIVFYALLVWVMNLFESSSDKPDPKNHTDDGSEDIS